ncbi:MAG: hypothetical protein L0Z50_13050, partial [Verrucomicrobiales bacterium]|nr:hypothetical protein [Verrucomicrobiales bacterium]
AEHRAVAGLQYFREAADELVPELLTLMKTSKDAALVQYASMPLSVFRPGPEIIPALIDVFKNNPVAAEGLKGWFGTYFFRNKTDRGPAVQHLSPLLDSESPDERLLAALLLARTSAKDDPRLVATLIPVLQEANRQDGGAAHQRSTEALQALKQIGTPARSAAEAIQEYGRKMPGMRELVLDALASTAPDLRTEIPELDAKLKSREEAAALEERAKSEEIGVSGLLSALQNPEARMHAIEKIGGLGKQAAEALPRLYEILKTGDSDSRPDANNYLFALVTAIRQIDPSAPTYYRPEELLPAFMDATRDLKDTGTTPPWH